MTGFMNSDGSSLVGGLNPSGIGQAFAVDALGKLLTQDWLRQATIAGQAFIATNGCPSLAMNNYAMSVFNPANSGKSILIYSVRLSNGSGSSFQQLSSVTVDPAYGNTATPVNTKLGGAASAIATKVTYASTNQAITGTDLIAEPGPQNTAVELLANGATILLPAGAANGLIAYITTFGSGYVSECMRWIEF